MAEVAFYFSYGCPWTYLACTRLQETALRTDARIVWKPVSIERLRSLLGMPSESRTHQPANAQRARYERKDLADWAAYCGVRIDRRPPYPLPATLAARAGVVAIEEDVIARFSDRLYVACFERLADPDSMDTIAGIADSLGLDAADFLRRVQSAETLRIVEENCAELVLRGGFGSPTMFVGDDLYFGNDRMPLVEWALVRRAERPLIAPGAHGQA